MKYPTRKTCFFLGSVSRVANVGGPRAAPGLWPAAPEPGPARVAGFSRLEHLGRNIEEANLRRWVREDLGDLVLPFYDRGVRNLIAPPK